MPENELIDVSEIIDLLLTDEPNISNIADHAYHLNKSLGVTYTSIRHAIKQLPLDSQVVAVRVFMQVIQALNSPTMFIDDDL